MVETSHNKCIPNVNHALALHCIAIITIFWKWIHFDDVGEKKWNQFKEPADRSISVNFYGNIANE